MLVNKIKRAKDIVYKSRRRGGIKPQTAPKDDTIFEFSLKMGTFTMLAVIISIVYVIL